MIGDGVRILIDRIDSDVLYSSVKDFDFSRSENFSKILQVTTQDGNINHVL